MFTFHFEFPVSIGLIDDVILSNQIKHKLSIFYSGCLGFNYSMNAPRHTIYCAIYNVDGSSDL